MAGGSMFSGCPSVRPPCSHERNISRMLRGNVIKFGLNIQFDPLILVVKGQKVKVTWPWVVLNTIYHVITSGTNIHLDLRVTWVEFGGQRSRSLWPHKAHIFALWMQYLRNDLRTFTFDTNIHFDLILGIPRSKVKGTVMSHIVFMFFLNMIS